MQAVIAERFRQVEVEGWSAKHHDEAHLPGEIAMAGGCYAICHTTPSGEKCPRPSMWPWSLAWWKPQDFRRDLVRGAALIIAEGEKFDRHRRAPSFKPLAIPQTRPEPIAISKFDRPAATPVRGGTA
jgi:hypothetical protein